MKIFLPVTVFLGNFEPFLDGFDPSNPEMLEVSSEPTATNVHPVVLAMLAALGSRVEPGRVDLSKLQSKSRDDLAQMGLFRALGIESNANSDRATGPEPAGRFIPITNIRDSAALGEFLKDITPLLHLSQDKSESIRYVMSELGRNVLEHARSRTGAFVAAKYYTDSNTVRIGIADSGIGIRASIMQSHAAPTDLDAIKLALTPGITGATAKVGGTEQNAGAGLFFIKSLAAANGSHMVLYSGNSMYKLLKRRGERLVLHADPFAYHHSHRSNLPHWQGTVVGVDINLDSTIEFNAVMDYVREAFAEAIRERKKANRHKQPRFI